MAMQKCYECGKLVSTTARACENCGAWVKTPFLQGNIGKLCIMVMISLLLFVIFVKWNAPKQSVTAPQPPLLTDEQVTDLINEAERKSSAFLNSKAGSIWTKHKNWSREDCESIAKREIYIGMNAEQVRLAWGKPYRINASTGSWGEHEQWVMHEGGSTYLYFENGKLTSMQRSK